MKILIHCGWCLRHMGTGCISSRLHVLCILVQMGAVGSPYFLHRKAPTHLSYKAEEAQLSWQTKLQAVGSSSWTWLESVRLVASFLRTICYSWSKLNGPFRQAGSPSQTQWAGNVAQEDLLTNSTFQLHIHLWWSKPSALVTDCVHDHHKMLVIWSCYRPPISTIIQIEKTSQSRLISFGTARLGAWQTFSMARSKRMQ